VIRLSVTLDGVHWIAIAYFNLGQRDEADRMAARETFRRGLAVRVEVLEG